MRLFDFDSGALKKLPVPPEVLLLCSGFRGRLGRFFFLNRFISKMAGLVFCSNRASRFLYRSGIARIINEKLSETFAAFQYANLNEAFSHRRDRRHFPPGASDENCEKGFISSPADAYLSIRPINAEAVEFLPGVYVNIPRMSGISAREAWLNGILLVFTLKPHHGHTVDFPVDSRIISKPREYNKKKVFVGSTDLEFIRHSAVYKRPVYEENHRVVTFLEALPFHEKYLFIEIGANIVNSIEQDYDPNASLFLRGSRKSHFNFGSTVCLILPDSLMQKVRVIEEILKNAGDDKTCEVKRGTAILYARDLACGEYQVSDRVMMTLAGGVGRVRRAVDVAASRRGA